MKAIDKKAHALKNSPSEKEKEKLTNEFEGGKKTTLEQIFKAHQKDNVLKA